MNTTERPNLNAIRQRAEAAMPGPWFWWGNVDVQRISLVGRRNLRAGIMTVMDFTRWGMQGAQPQFCDERGLLVKASVDPMPVYQVCPEATTRQDPRVYRGDFLELRHPDAQFIAHARQDIDDLLAYIAHLEATHGD